MIEPLPRLVVGKDLAAAVTHLAIKDLANLRAVQDRLKEKRGYKNSMVHGGEKMADGIDKIVRTLQDAIFKGYSEKFKKEFLNPQNIGKIENADSQVSITGVCGDTVEMYLAIKDGSIDDIKFMTDGCGATIACASYVARAVKGKTIEEALLMKPEGVDSYFEGLPEESKHCAQLAIDTLKAALNKYKNKEYKLKLSSVKRKKKDTSGRGAIF